MLPISQVIETVDAVPGQLSGVAVADLEVARRLGPAGRRRPDHRAALAGADGARIDWPKCSGPWPIKASWSAGSTRLAAAEQADRYTATALTGRIAPGLGVLAAMLLVLGIGLTAAGRRGVLVGELAALRLGGLSRATSSRATLVATVGPALLAVVVGAAAGAVGSALVIRSLPLLPNAQSAIRVDLALLWPTLLGTAGVMAVVVVAAAAAAGRAAASAGRARPEAVR